MPVQFQRFNAGLGIALTIALSACGGGGGTNSEVAGSSLPPASVPSTSSHQLSDVKEAATIPSDGRAQLKSVAGAQACEVLETRIESLAKAQLNESANSLLKQYQQGIGGVPRIYPALDLAASASMAGASSTQSFSSTNLAVSGVDEADVVKNNGRFIYVARANDVAQIEILSGGLPVQHPSIPTKSNAGLLLSEGRLTTFSQTQYRSSLSGEASTCPHAVPFLGTAELVDWPSQCTMGSPFEQLAIFDISNPKAPTSLATHTLEGTSLGSRRIGDVVYVAQRANFRFDLSTVLAPETLGLNEESFKAAIDQQVQSQVAKIETRTLGEWLSPVLGPDAPPPTPETCQAFGVLDAPIRPGWITLHSFSANSGKRLAQQSLLTDATRITLSPYSVILASDHWQWIEGANPSTQTYLTRIHLAANGQFEFKDSGVVPGTVLTPFGIQETAQRELRIAAQDIASATPVSYLAKLASNDGTLTIAHRSIDIAPGEMLQSVRFSEDKAYVVTFRRIDPFFVFDFSQNGPPQKLGELKVPGFSTYLHVLSDTRVLGIGWHVPEAGAGFAQYPKATLFDVSQPDAPREIQSMRLGDEEGYTWSEALFEHRAITFSPSGQQFALPLVGYQYAPQYEQTSTLALLNFTANGLENGGTIPLGDIDGYRVSQRGIYLGEMVYAVTDQALHYRKASDSAAAPVEFVLQ